ncbi:MAG: hypothetical protein F4X77_05665 [Acidobacteriia bacterium]|nr:hypothetical protein [Terriglobia bacterium]
MPTSVGPVLVIEVCNPEATLNKSTHTILLVLIKRRNKNTGRRHRPTSVEEHEPVGVGSPTLPGHRLNQQPY